MKKTQSFPLRLPYQLYLSLKRIAKEQRRSINSHIVTSMERVAHESTGTDTRSGVERGGR